MDPACIFTTRCICRFLDNTTNGGQESETPSHTSRNVKWKSKIKHLLLGVGFCCIIICFILASMGYMKLKECRSGTKCKEEPDMFSKAQNFRLTAALLFIVGICLIIVFVWTIKHEQTAHTRTTVIVQDVMVSNVTPEGLQKSPAPILPHPFSQIHHLVYEIPASESGMSSDNLPNYETVVELLNAEKRDAKPNVTPLRETVIIRGVEMESVSIQVDEDELDPPPSYTKALELENENREGTTAEERE